MSNYSLLLSKPLRVLLVDLADVCELDYDVFLALRAG